MKIGKLKGNFKKKAVFLFALLQTCNLKITLALGSVKL